VLVCQTDVRHFCVAPLADVSHRGAVAGAVGPEAACASPAMSGEIAISATGNWGCRLARLG